MLKRSIVLAAAVTALASPTFAQDPSKPEAKPEAVKRPTVVVCPILAWAGAWLDAIGARLIPTG
jgi:hypothetical protein